MDYMSLKEYSRQNYQCTVAPTDAVLPFEVRSDLSRSRCFLTRLGADRCMRRRGPNSNDAELTTTSTQQLKCHNLSLVIFEAYGVDLFHFSAILRRGLNRAYRVDASKSTCRCTRLLIYIWV